MPTSKRSLLDELFRTAPPLNSEDDCAENVVIPLFLSLGYDRQSIKRKVSITGTAGRRFKKQADIVVYVGTRPGLVIETKRLRHRLSEEDVSQALSYAQLIEPPAPYALLTNGRDWELYRLKEDSIGGLEDLPEPPELEAEVLGFPTILPTSEREAAERLLVTIENKPELESAFRQCRKSLAKEGLIAESAFDELTKILVCKFNEEKRSIEGIGPYRFTLAWLRGEGALTGLQRLFTDARQRFRVFPTGTSMSLRSNETVEEVVGLLEPFGFLGTKTPLGLAGSGGDVVGSVYETFLTGTLRGDLGQYLTPRQLVEFMVHVADVQPSERVLDLSAGSGGFIIRSFIDVRKKLRAADMSPEERQVKVNDLVQNDLWGIEINERLATLARINMILHGDGYEHIYTGDSIRDEVFENTDGRSVSLSAIESGELPKFDVILMNPPFNLAYQDEAVMNRYELGRGKAAQGSDYLLLERALRLMREETGRLLIIMPHGVASGASEGEIRRFVESKGYLAGCISLPVGAFKPFGGSNARTCILWITSGKVKNRFLAQAETVGYDISSKYYLPVERNDLIDIREALDSVKSEVL